MSNATLKFVRNFVVFMVLCHIITIAHNRSLKKKKKVTLIRTGGSRVPIEIIPSIFLNVRYNSQPALPGPSIQLLNR